MGLPLRLTPAPAFLITSAAVLLIAPTRGRAEAASGSGKDGCVSCHSDPQLRVTNKKLFDYFRSWETSVHGAAGITCTECHGGNPRAKSKAEAHRGRAGEATSATSPLSYQNVADTCASCHANVMEGYRTSKHYQLLVSDKAEKRGPTCVTCHGSVNVGVMGPHNVREVCSQCHNAATANHPDVPDQAAYILGRFLAVDRYESYVSKRGRPEDIALLRSELEPRRAALARHWHAFDLDAVETEVHDLVGSMRQLVDNMRKVRKEQGSPEGK